MLFWWGAFVFFLFLFLSSKISRNKARSWWCVCLLRLFFFFFFLFCFLLKIRRKKKHLSLLTYVRMYVTYTLRTYTGRRDLRYESRRAVSRAPSAVMMRSFFFFFSQQTCPVRDYTLFWSNLSFFVFCFCLVLSVFSRVEFSAMNTE